MEKVTLLSTIIALCTFLPITVIILHVFGIFMSTVTVTHFLSAHHHMPRTQQGVIFKPVSKWLAQALIN